MAINVPLSADQITRVLDVIGMKESSSVPGGPINKTIGRGAKDGAIKKGHQNYGVINSINYIGKYQLGYVALVEAGFVKRGPTKNSALFVADNWLGTEGCNSADDFLTNPNAQESAARKLFAVNYSYLRKEISDCAAPDVAGYCAAAWLVGQGGAKALRRGVDKVDGNGTCASYYFNMGRTACLGSVPEIVKPPAVESPAGTKPEPKKDEEQKSTDYVSATKTTPTAPAPAETPRVVVPERRDEVKVPPEIAQKYSNTGFIDPNLAYPRSNYKKFPDTNKLTTGVGISDTIVKKKNDARVTRIPTASGNEWEEPVSPYAAEYPFNKVTESESGHVTEIDDTPGHERIHQYHRSGSYTETNNVGSRVTRIVGDSYEIIDRNGNIFINGRCNITVGGPAHILVLADCNLNVKGNTNFTSENDVNWEVSGNMNLMVNEDLNIRAKNLNVEVDEKRNTYVGQTSNEQVYGHVVQQFDAGVDTRIKGIHNHEVTIDMNTSVGGDSALEVTGKHTEKVTGDYILSAATMQENIAGQMDIKAGGNYHLDSPRMELNNGSAAPGDPKDLTVLEIPVVTHTNLRYAVDRRAYTDSSTANLPYESKADNTAQLMTEHHVVDAQPSAPTGDAPVNPPTPSAPPAETPSDNITIDPETFLQMTEFPNSLQISKFFTLGQLLCGNKLQDQNGLTKAQLVYNLSVLAQNVLDKIKYNYGNMKINSGFRTGTSGSQHNKGQACDFKLTGVPLSEYEACAKWVAANTPYDQIILEANQSRKDSLWIHVSCKSKFGAARNPGAFTGFNQGTAASKTTLLPGIQLAKLDWLDTSIIRTA